VCQPSEPVIIPEKGKPDLKKLSNLTAQAVIKALESNSRVWIYPVSSLHGKKLAGMVAVSRDYLQEAVAETIAKDPVLKSMPDGSHWLRNQLPAEIQTVLNRHKVYAGYATLAGVVRPVWTLPANEIKLEKGKSIRTQSVEVSERIYS
jgi:hypothetical protein